MIITIDGPTASGKSTIAQHIAQKLGYLYINSGLLFRAAAYVLQEQSLSHTDPEALTLVTTLFTDGALSYSYSSQDSAQIWYHGSSITPQLKTPTIDSASSEVATNEQIRDLLLEYQRSLSQAHSLVAEGRDTGSVVFPHADVKLYVTASLAIRASRWQKDQQKKGTIFSQEESVQHVQERDVRDEQRTVAPLVIPRDATVIDTSNLTIDESVAACLKVIHSTVVHPTSS